MTKILDIHQECTACMACYNICPEHAISMIEEEDGFLYPQINEDKCTNCLLCEKVCPCLNDKEKPVLQQKAYYGWHTNDEIRKNSSSGGVFTAFAENILKNNGVVFGAVYDSKKHLVLHNSTVECTLESMRKSKYVQSYIGTSFQTVKNILKKGKVVFFVGTPCQIAGLKNYFDDGRLITCDFICHGVPPMRLLNENFKLLQKKHKDKIINFDFRPKIKSWSFDFFSIFFENKGKKNIQWSSDSYYKGFTNNLTLRKSCYRCPHSYSQHIADITIADYWGYRRYDESIFDNRGISLIIANTQKGENLIKAIDKNEFVFNPLEWKYAEYVFSPRSNENYNIEKRNAFFEYYKKAGYKKAVKRFKLVPTFKTKMKNKVVTLKKTLGI